MKKSFHIKSILFAFLLLLAHMPCHLQAMVVVVPPGLSFGDSYRLIFVTSNTRTGDSSNIADYNAFVSATAATSSDLNALSTNWFAVASTATVDARDNTNTNPNLNTGVPIYRLDGSLVANNNADLWDGALINRIRFDETGNLPFSDTVWTGTETDGTASDSGLAANPTPLGGVEPGVADSGRSNSDWISEARNVNPGIAQFSFYGISDVISVVPEPGTYALLTGVCAFVMVMLRRCFPRRD